jgi:hypothetical protein
VLIGLFESMAFATIIATFYLTGGSLAMAQGPATNGTVISVRDVVIS